MRSLDRHGGLKHVGPLRALSWSDHIFYSRQHGIQLRLLFMQRRSTG